MNLAQLQAIAPLLALSLGAIVLMLQISFKRNSDWSYAIALLALIGAALAVLPAARAGVTEVTPLLKADRLALFFSTAFCLAGAITAVFSRSYLRAKAEQSEEYFLLLLLSTMGAATLAYAAHPASLLLGLELMSVALYALIAYPDRGTLPLEAAIKYLVLSGAASATMLFGVALIYAATGALSYSEVATAIAQTDSSPLLMLAGAAMILSGLGFKISAVPFHMWTPDVYEGAPAPISGFLAAVSKAAVFVAILRWFVESELYQHSGLVMGISALAAASILIGNLLALRQTNIKRMLAYSSIAHVGYLLITLVACASSTTRALAIEAASFYLVAYMTTTLAAFALIGLLSRADQDTDNDQLEQLTGLFWSQPLLAALFSIALLSLAGIPLTVGFIGKFYIFSAGVDASLWSLLGILVIGSAIAIYYYLRVIYQMTLAVPDSSSETKTTLKIGERTAIYLLIIAMLYFGILPQALMEVLTTIL